MTMMRRASNQCDTRIASVLLQHEKNHVAVQLSNESRLPNCEHQQKHQPERSDRPLALKSNLSLALLDTRSLGRLLWCQHDMVFQAWNLALTETLNELHRASGV